MTFPATFDVFGMHVHPHPVLELAGYLTGSQLFLWERRHVQRTGQLPTLHPETTAWIFAAMLAGAALGAFGLAALEHLHEPGGDGTPVPAWFGAVPPAWVRGKTIVGGLLGGWLGIELAKGVLHVGFTTGDLFVLPLTAGIALGRIGCFLTGLEDGTYGLATTLPWSVDFGDGIARHPTQLYESLFVLILGAALTVARRPLRGPGLVFRVFLGAYFAFRFAVEFIKPVSSLALGLSAIQWAALVGLSACFLSWRRLATTSVRVG